MKMKMVILLKMYLQSLHSDETITDILICIGPRGLSREGNQCYYKRWWKSVSLGNTILRAETAAIGSLAMIQYELEL